MKKNGDNIKKKLNLKKTKGKYKNVYKKKGFYFWVKTCDYM